MRSTGSRLALTVIIATALASCGGGSGAGGAAKGSSRGVVMVSPAARELSFSAVFHRRNAEEGTWHLIVERDGSMASKAFFTTDVSPGKLYESLRAIGASDGNNVGAENFDDEDIATGGDAIDFLFDWKGLGEPMRLEDFIAERVPDLPSSGGARGIEMRFGGNMTGEDAASPPCHASGCLACLYTCSAGVTSSSKANHALLKKEGGMHRYRVSPKVDIPDGTRVRVIVRKRP
ncbi:MAG: hypothetical protein HY721_00835 [Planctomycetes bacterium]|nr:hypothetical protein [Planctomycetota bacterium]